jgi:hypothetical protein
MQRYVYKMTIDYNSSCHHVKRTALFGIRSNFVLTQTMLKLTKYLNKIVHHVCEHLHLYQVYHVKEW